MTPFKRKLIEIKYSIKYFLKNCLYYRKLRLCDVKKIDTLYFVFDPKCGHPGLADRMKAIIRLYNCAKKNGFDFKLYFKTPFDINDYWHLKKENAFELDELEYSLCNTVFLNECNWHELPKLKKGKQYHCYNYAGNNMPWEFADTGYKWHELFHELFEPSENLRNALKSLCIDDKDYISVQLRFVNALENFEAVSCCDNELHSEDDRLRLIEKCKNGIRRIIKDNPGKTVYVFSDSKRFLDSLNDMDVKIIDYGIVGHSGMKKANNQLSQMRTFLDLEIMSHSSAIYRIKAKELYNLSCFALLASRMNNIKFIDVDLG